MIEVIKIKKGLDINLLGKPSEIFLDVQSSKSYAIRPSDFHNLSPKLVVKEGDVVKCGSPLFHDKKRSEIMVGSPVSGVVTSIVRGERRAIEEVVVESDGLFESLTFSSISDSKHSKHDVIINSLLQSCCWSFIKERPFNITPDPEVIPRDIFISGFNSAPLAADLDVVVFGKENYLQFAIDALTHLTSGKIYLSLSVRAASKALHTLKGVKIVHFDGPHPAGNVGTQINKIHPINKGEVVWTIQLQDLVTIGKVLSEGIYDSSRVVALTGSSYLKPSYVKTHIGASIESFVKGRVANTSLRFISGNVLTGTQIPSNGYLGYFDNQLTVIPEGDNYQFLGWALPNASKFSVYRTFFSWLMPKREYEITANLNGGHRAIVLSGEYEKVFPLDVMPEQLIKAIIAEDIDAMEQLGIYEVVEEDFALCEFIDVSKLELQKIVRNGLNLMMKEIG